MRLTAAEYRQRLQGRDPRTVDPAELLGKPKEAAPPAQPASALVEPIRLTLTLPPKGKARGRAFVPPEELARAVARVRRGEPLETVAAQIRISVRKPKPYAEWLRSAVRQIREQWPGGTLERVNRVAVRLVGGSRACDGDNAIGSPLDALVKAEALKDDRLTAIPAGSWEWVPGESPRIEIVLS